MNLHDILLQSKSDRKVWLNMLDYANQIFANGSDELWSTPTNFISIFSQGQELLKSDVLSIPVQKIYENFLLEHEHLKEQWSGMDPIMLIEEILGFDEPKQFLSDVLNGLQNLFSGTFPLVVEVPSPQNWLKWLNGISNPQDDSAIEEADVEFASMFVADYLRHFSTINISAVVLTEENPDIELENSLVLYQPILNVVEHFKWIPGLNLVDGNVNVKLTEDKFAFILRENSSALELEQYGGNNNYIGGGLNEEFWGNEAEVNLPSSGFFYGKIPYDSNPETVLNKIRLLRSE